MEESAKKIKRKYFLLGAAVALAAAFLVVGIIIWKPVSGSVQDPSSMDAYKKIRELENCIDRNYLGEIDKQTLADYMYLGLVTGLGDPYSTYFTKEEYDGVNRTQQGEYRGIGVTISNREEDSALIITGVTENGPAQRAGIEAGDQILAIDGTDYSHATSSEAAEYIRSLKTDSVELTVYRESEEKERTFTVPLEALEAYSVGYAMLDDQIGYIAISSFTAVTPKQFEEARKELEGEGMKALIVDLRNNQGGLVSSVHGVLNSFMPEGLLFYTEAKDGTGNQYYSDGSNPLTIPLAVLVNENTASASEIFAGAVKDYELGTLIGTVTFGKGIVQNAYSLSDGSVVRLTISHYYTPNGNDIHEKGITPDIELENSETEDLQFDKAVEVLEEKTGSR